MKTYTQFLVQVSAKPGDPMTINSLFHNKKHAINRGKELKKKGNTTVVVMEQEVAFTDPTIID